MAAAVGGTIGAGAAGGGGGGMMGGLGGMMGGGGGGGFMSILGGMMGGGKKKDAGGGAGGAAGGGGGGSSDWMQIAQDATSGMPSLALSKAVQTPTTVPAQNFSAGVAGDVPAPQYAGAPMADSNPIMDNSGMTMDDRMRKKQLGFTV